MTAPLDIGLGAGPAGTSPWVVGGAASLDVTALAGAVAPPSVVTVAAAALLAAATWLAWPPAPVASRARPRPRGWVLRGWALRGGRLRRTRPERSDAVARVSDLAEVADLLALVLTAGRGVAEALELVGARYPGPLGRQLRTVAAASRWGLPEEQQWASVAPEWGPLRGALAIAAESGSAPAEGLAAAAEDLRRGEAHRVEVAASEFGAKAVLPLGLAFLPAFVLTTVVPVVLTLAGDLIGP